MNKRIVDPTIPYIGPINSGDFYPGNIIRIQGITPSAAYCYNISLQCEPEPRIRTDIALQIEIHVLEGFLKLNSLQNGIWGKEQLDTLPVATCKQFEVILTCEVNQYQVTINGKYYCGFPQRIEYPRIKYLTINGDVSIFLISFESTISRDDLEGTSGNGTNEISQPPASILTNAPDEDEFEVAPSAPTAPPDPESYISPFSESFSPPPSYETVIDASNRAPYPLSDPLGMPFPRNILGGTGSMHVLPYPLADEPGMHPLPPRKKGTLPPISSTPLLLNTDSSNSRSGVSSRSNDWDIIRYIIYAILTIILMIALIFKLHH